MTAITYSRYLHLTELLSLQHPLTPPDQPEVCDSERLFIAVHQASETLLSQALVDLRHIAANDCGQRCFGHRVDRATRLVDALAGHLTLLRHTLPQEDFLLFRSRLGTASGLKSAQFHELFALSGRLATADDDHRVATDRQRVARLGAALQRWRRTHLELVEHMIGDRPGTGHTSGVRYLTRRLNESSQDDRADRLRAVPARAATGS